MEKQGDEMVVNAEHTFERTNEHLGGRERKKPVGLSPSLLFPAAAEAACH